MQDLRFGFRMAWKNPGFTIVAVLTLAVGIAANTTVFSWIDAVLVRPIPGVTNGTELAAFETVTPNGEFITTSYPDYRDYRDHLTMVSGLTVATPQALSIGEEETAERVWSELVAGNYFAVLGVQPVAGRVFSADESGDKLGGYPVAVISERLWKRRFQNSPGAIGQTIRVNRQQLTIVGVAPAEFRGSIPGLTFDVWVPVVMGTQLNIMPDWMLRDRKTRNLVSLARLKPGVTIEQARAEVAAQADQLAKMDPNTNGGISATLLPIWKGHIGAQGLLLEPLRILMAVCAVVLLIVCANVANLLLARATARQKEFGIRVALGAGRARVVRQMLTETLVLAVMGAAAAFPMALVMRRALGYLLPPSGLPIALDVRMNADILVFTMLVCVVACVVSGVVPALQTARTDLNEVLQEGGRGGTASRSSQRIRGLLVAGEVALALVALIGAGLFAKSFQLARQIHPGFDPNNVMVAHLSLSTAGYAVPDRKQFCERLRARIQEQPGIAGAVYADTIPLGIGGESWEDLQIEGYTPELSENMKVSRNVVAPGYLDLLKIPLLEGRDFTEQDDLASQPVMIVNETFARRYFSGGTAIGRRVRGWGKWFTVIGVAKDSKYRTPNEAPQRYFYVPFRQVYRADMGIAVYLRTAGDPNRALVALQGALREMDTNVGVYDAMPLTEYISASLFPQKVAALLLGALGTLALLLAAVGLYSVMAYSMARRTHEIGIRMALGAQASDVLGLAVKQGMMLTLAGLLAGGAAAAVVTRLAAGLLVNVSATDPLVFGGAALFLAAVALGASYIPARRATRIDPSTALRRE